jgi:hypothetical protein
MKIQYKPYSSFKANPVELTTWIVHIFYEHDANDLDGISVELAVANLIELLTEKGLISLYDVARILNYHDPLVPAPD